MKWARQQRIEHAGLVHMLSILATVADKRGQSWRAQLTLADEMAVTERCVRRYLRALEKLGVIQRAHRSNGRGGRSSDLIRLRLDRPFTITKDAARAVLQPEPLSGSSRSSNRTITTVQPEQRSGDKDSDQLEKIIYQEEQTLEVGNTREATAGPALRIVNGGRA